MRTDWFFPRGSLVDRWLVGRALVFLLCMGNLSVAHGDPTPHVGTAVALPLNVLMIAVDDLNDEVGCLGSTVALTPNIDRLARRGTVFRRAYCQQAVCNPSRASLMTGLSPDTLRVWDLRTHFRDTRPEVVTLPELFKRHGYFTRGIGKIYHNWGKLTFEGDPQSWSVPQTYHYAPHYSDWYIAGAVRGTPAEVQGPPTQCEDVPDQTYFDGRIADAAVKALGELQNEPFFLAVGFWKPHLPFNAPKKYWDLYDPNAIPSPNPSGPPRNGVDIAQHNFRELRGYAGMPKKGLPTTDEVKHLRHGYFAAISFLDTQVGKLLDELDRLGLAESTIVVLWSDHGFHLGEHALWAKTSNFERDARVPLIVSAPHQEVRGRGSDSLAELLDIYPTLIELAGLPAPHRLEGRSLVPALDDPEHRLRQAALTQHPRPPYYQDAPEVMGYSIRTPSYRYTQWRQVKGNTIVAEELYDHEEDSAESINLARDARFAGTLRDLAMLLEQTIQR